MAQCWVGSQDIGGWLVSNGLAVAYRRYSSNYIAAEQDAKNRNAGVWAGSFTMPWDFRHHTVPPIPSQ